MAARRFQSMLLRTLSAAALAVLVAGCATPPKDDPEALAAFNEANDPWEPFNRGVFDFNMAFDSAILRPITIAYKEVVPERGRRGVTNALKNLRSPVILANDILQGESERALIILGRFLVNSTIGLLGLFDVAAEIGLELHDEDFGQTLAVWGADEGPYIMLPFLGPSNPRDTVGLIADILFDPFTYVVRNNDIEWAYFVRTAIIAVDERSRNVDTLDEVERTSVDYYAAIRSLYRQRRSDEIRNGDPPIAPAPRLSMDGGSGASGRVN